MAARATAKGVLPVLRYDEPAFETAFQRLVDRRDQQAEDVEKTVRKIVDRVRQGGDAELDRDWHKLIDCTLRALFEAIDLLHVNLGPENNRGPPQVRTRRFCSASGNTSAPPAAANDLFMLVATTMCGWSDM